MEQSILDGAMSNVEVTTLTTLSDMILARRYNNFTGSTISHHDVNEWGVITRAEIESALALAPHI